jgi:small subunit ribosomal protein S13
MAEKEKKPEEKAKTSGQQKVPAKPDKKESAPREMKNVIRLVETNLEGNNPVESAIRNIDGISFMLSEAISKKTGLRGKKLGELSEGEMKALEEAIINPASLGIPAWMLNRRKEPVTAKDRHLVASQLDFTHKMDINELKKLKCYKGVRHIQGQPVRGQRTRSSFRKGKSVGVRRKKPEPAAAAKK